MSFSGKKRVQKTTTIRKDSSLSDFFIRFLLKLSHRKGQRSHSPKENRRHSASATVEALMLFPIVVTFFFSFIWIIDVIRIHSTIGSIVNEVGSKMVSVSYTKSVILSNDEKESLIERVGTIVVSEEMVRIKVEKSNVYEHINYFVCLPSFGGQGDEISLLATYQVKPPINIPGFNGIRLANRFYSKTYVGYKAPSESTEYVYVTKNSDVYHTHRNCQALKVNATQVTEEGLKKARNKSGGKYYPCSDCEKEKSTGLYYISPYGNKYHKRANCENLNIEVYRVPLREVSERRKCYLCK